MLIKNAKQNEESKDWEFDLDLRGDEVDYLVNMSIQFLLTTGMVALKEQDEEQEVALPEQNAPTSDTIN